MLNRTLLCLLQLETDNYIKKTDYIYKNSPSPAVLGIGGFSSCRKEYKSYLPPQMVSDLRVCVMRQLS